MAKAGSTADPSQKGDQGLWPASLAAALAMAVILLAGTTCYDVLESALRAGHRAQQATALADHLAQAAGGAVAGSTDLKAAAKKVEQRHAPLVDFAFVTESGGMDEFGISRGAGFAWGQVADKKTRDALFNHAKSLTSVAQSRASRGESVPFDRLHHQLPDGRLVIAVPYRAKGEDSAALGIAGVVLKLQNAGAGSPGWIWLLIALCPLLLVVAVRFGRLPVMAAGVVTMVLGSAALIAVAPALMPAPGGGVQILAGQYLFPHGPATVSAALTDAHSWLSAGLLAMAVIAGLLIGPLATLLSAMRRDPVPYFYVGPAVLATGVLIFVPFAVGVGLGFTYRGEEFVGLSNYDEVLRLATGGHGATHFFRTLLHTVVWTFANVFLHVTIGLGLALVLNRPDLRGRRYYRLLLIIPWAVPNYITALTWKWMFNTQYGPINEMMQAIGVGQIDWLGQSPWANFAANLITNVWLGFPFMMVISLGALQSIPAELYEAASIDGARARDKFRHITMPLLRPALFPAIILGTIWTFNAFNIIYLVSGGGPDHQTEILITEAYYIFTVLQRTGLAAAYSVIIFVLLLAYTLVTNRLTSATEAVD